MKLISVLILFICLFAATFSNWLIIASFSENQQYIAKELCVNRNNPNSTCNGHCYLCKQMNKAEKPEGTNTGTKEKFEVQLFFTAAPQSCGEFSAPKKTPGCLDRQFAEQQCLKSFFHPPPLI